MEHNPNVWNTASSVKPAHIGFYGKDITLELVQKAHKLKFKVYAFHVNGMELGAKMKEDRVDEIGTDFPKMFIGK